MQISQKKVSYASMVERKISFKNSWGKFIAPLPLEEKVKKSSLVKEVIVVGDERKYLVALVTLDTKKALHLNPRLIKERLAAHLNDINKP